MDFRQTAQPSMRPSTPSVSPVAPEAPKKRPTPTPAGSNWLRILNIVVLFGVAILVAAIAFSFTSNRSSASEAKFVNTAKYQAVFLTNGQVYFGNIKNLSNNYIDLTNVYYLTQASDTTTAAANSSYTLVKLGCQQIHDPADQMLINRSQVTFWENLQEDDGKVVSKIKEFIKANPKGPDCTQVSTQTQASSSATTQGSTTTTTPTTTTTKP